MQFTQQTNVKRLNIYVVNAQKKTSYVFVVITNDHGLAIIK